MLFACTCRKERSAHAKLLLQQLKSSKLGPPFTEDPPTGLLSIPAASLASYSPIDQNSELDSLLTSAFSPSHHTLPHSQGSPSHYRYTSTQNHILASEDSNLTSLPQHSEHRTSNLDSQRQFIHGDLSSQTGPRTRHKTESSWLFEPQLHSTAVGAASLRHKRTPGRVYYSDTVLYLGGQPGKTSPSRHSSGVSSCDHGRSIQTNIPNGISNISSKDFKYTHQPTATSSLNHGSHRLSSTSRRDDVMDRRSFSWGQEVVDDDDDFISSLLGVSSSSILVTLTLMFCHRWLLICLKREFPEEDALAFWESCWTNYETTSFHMFICIAIMARGPSIEIWTSTNWWCSSIRWVSLCPETLLWVRHGAICTGFVRVLRYTVSCIWSWPGSSGRKKAAPGWSVRMARDLLTGT